jgi:hypothetical protein
MITLQEPVVTVAQQIGLVRSITSWGYVALICTKQGWCYAAMFITDWEAKAWLERQTKLSNLFEITHNGKRAKLIATKMEIK